MLNYCRGRVTEYNIMVSVMGLDGRVCACVERNMTHATVGDPLNPRLTFSESRTFSRMSNRFHHACFRNTARSL